MLPLAIIYTNVEPLNLSWVPITIGFTNIAPRNMLTLMGARGLLPLAITFTSIEPLNLIADIGSHGVVLTRPFTVAGTYQSWRELAEFKTTVERLPQA